MRMFFIFTGSTNAAKKVIKKENPSSSTFNPVKVHEDFKKIQNGCLYQQVLWDDPLFKPPLESYCTDATGTLQYPIVWKRPIEIVENPCFHTKQPCRFDFQQGCINDSWLVSAFAQLPLLSEVVFDETVPKDQDFDDNYAGVFHFSFWRYDRRVDILVDDLLPTCNNKLIFTTPTNNDFWTVLLEKAYAKLLGSYSALEQQYDTSEVLIDLSGGVTERFGLFEPPVNLLDILNKAYERNSAICCTKEPDQDESESELRSDTYTIKSVNVITQDQTQDTLGLMCLRPAWISDGTVRHGWQSKSGEWQEVFESKKKGMGAVDEAAGEFWVSYDDFIKEFTIVELCHISLQPDDLVVLSKKGWYLRMLEGAMDVGAESTIMDVPHLKLSLVEFVEPEEERNYSVVIALMQAHGGSNTASSATGFSVYKLYDDETIDPNEPGTSFVGVMREVTGRVSLAVGDYGIVLDHCPEQFLLRVMVDKDSVIADSGYSEDEFDVQLTELENKLEIPMTPLSFSMDSALLAISEEEVLALLKQLLPVEPTEIELRNFYNSAVTLYGGTLKEGLDFKEQGNLWADIQIAKGIFLAHSKKQPGYLSESELAKAVVTAGYEVNDPFLDSLIEDHTNDKGQLSFIDFVSVVKLKKTFDKMLKEAFPEGMKEEFPFDTLYSMVMTDKLNVHHFPLMLKTIQQWQEKCVKKDIDETDNLDEHDEWENEEGMLSPMEPIFQILADCHAKSEEDSSFLDFTTRARKLVDLFENMTDKFTSNPEEKQETRNALIDSLEEMFTLEEE